MSVDNMYNKTSKPAEEAMALPLDIMIIIFLKLQIRPLFRCKSVCKLWRNTIHSCYFADLHRTRSPTCRESKLVLICYPSIMKTSSFEFYAINPQLSSNTFTLTQLPITEFTRIRGVWNLGHGLILVKGDVPNYILYNPIRGEKLILPPTTIINKEQVDANIALFGLGFDDSIKQYKLVCLTEVMSDDDSLQQAVEILTLGSNKWRPLTSTPPCSIFLLGCDFPTSAYGDVHWMTKTNYHTRKIVSFIFAKEEFKSSPLPDAITSLPDALDSFSLFNWREELAILETSSRFTMRNISVWVLRDYENAKWERMYALDLPPFPRCQVATWGDGFVFNISRIPWLVNGEMIAKGTRKFLHWDAKKGDLAVTINPALSRLLRGRRCYQILETYTDNLDSLTRYAYSVPDGSTPNHAQPT